MRFQTLTHPVRIRISGLLYSPTSFSTRNVGIRPPPKNIVITKYRLIAVFPGNFGLDSAYAANRVTITLSVMPVAV